jgi:hypothetical protein
MPGHHHFHAHFSSALDNSVKVIYFEPQQHAIAVRLVITVADPAVIVFYFEAVELENKLAVRDQSFIFAAAMIALATQQTLVPPAACFHICNGNKRLRTHGN